MKLKKSNRKRLNNFQKALLIGVPVAGAAIATGHVTLPQALLLGAGSAVIGTKISNIGYKTVYFDCSSLFVNRFIGQRFITCGLYPSFRDFIPSPQITMKKYRVQSGDTWELLAEQSATTVEVLLRLNDVLPERVLEIICANEIPDDLKLSVGSEIYIPVEIKGELWDCKSLQEKLSWENLRMALPPPKDFKEALRFVLPPEYLEKLYPGSNSLFSQQERLPEK